MKAVAFIGASGAGKTAFLRRLIPVLLARGYRVGAVKRVHADVEPDVPGKDSYVLRQAGAERVLLYSEAHGALFWDHEAEPVDAFLEQYMADLDLVLLEGFKESNYPKIEVYRSGEPLAGRIAVRAVVTDKAVRVPDGVPVLPPDPELVADFLEAEILEPGS